MHAPSNEVVHVVPLRSPPRRWLPGRRVANAVPCVVKGGAVGGGVAHKSNSRVKKHLRRARQRVSSSPSFLALGACAGRRRLLCTVSIVLGVARAAGGAAECDHVNLARGPCNPNTHRHGPLNHRPTPCRSEERREEQDDVTHAFWERHVANDHHLHVRHEHPHVNDRWVIDWGKHALELQRKQLR